MLSDRARHQWTAYANARQAHTTPFGDRDELNRFLVGIHLRGEVLAAAELGALLDEAGVEGREREDLATVVEAGLALLNAYDRQVEYEEQTYEEVQDHGGFRI